MSETETVFILFLASAKIKILIFKQPEKAWNGEEN